LASIVVVLVGASVAAVLPSLSRSKAPIENIQFHHSLKKRLAHHASRYSRIECWDPKIPQKLRKSH
jgi:hypothetical protein